MFFFLLGVASSINSQQHTDHDTVVRRCHFFLNSIQKHNRNFVEEAKEILRPAVEFKFLSFTGGLLLC